MGFFQDIISGGASSRKKSLDALRRSAVAQYGELASDYGDAFQSVMDRFTQDRATNISQFRTDMAGARADFTRFFDQARSEYSTGMDRALGEMRIGRDSTIELSRQQTERSSQRATAMNAFTGLSQSSFGQQRVESIGRQGVLQEGAIREQYSQQLSSLEAQRAAGLSTLSAQMGGGLSAIGQQTASGVSNLYQSYSSGLANMGQQSLANQYNMRQQGMNIGFNFGGQSAELSGASNIGWGNAIGSVVGATFGSKAAAGTIRGSSLSQMAPPSSFGGSLQQMQGFGNYWQNYGE